MARRAERVSTEDFTVAGWPRPIVGGWPIPWVSPSSDLSQMGPDRLDRVKREFLCQVCGEGHVAGATAHLLCRADGQDTRHDADLSTKVVLAMDHAALHERCARLSIGRCPRLRRLRDAGDLIVVVAPADALELFVVDGDEQIGVQGVAARILSDFA
jgi:hypothetical protein